MVTPQQRRSFSSVIFPVLCSRHLFEVLARPEVCPPWEDVTHAQQQGSTRIHGRLPWDVRAAFLVCGSCKSQVRSGALAAMKGSCRPRTRALLCFRSRLGHWTMRSARRPSASCSEPRRGWEAALQCSRWGGVSGKQRLRCPQPEGPSRPGALAQGKPCQKEAALFSPCKRKQLGEFRGLICRTLLRQVACQSGRFVFEVLGASVLGSTVAAGLCFASEQHDKRTLEVLSDLVLRDFRAHASFVA